MNRTDTLTQVFRDTQELIASTPLLKTASERTVLSTRLYGEDEWPELGKPARAGKIVVSERRSFEAARGIRARRPEARICVLNFASPVEPGGGVKRGSSAQEESLCRCSTLYDSLDQRRLRHGYYEPNRAARSFLANDACIWSPDVYVIKSDTDVPERLPQDLWFKVDVISCAAPNLRFAPRESSELPLTKLFEVHRLRARHILSVAASQGVDALVLGAFGCGAFRNDPYLVASAWHEEVRELGGHFDLIEFAVFHMPYETTNYEAFRDEFAAPDEA